LAALAVLTAFAAVVPTAVLASDAEVSSSVARSSYPPVAEVLESLHDPSGWTEHRRGAREGVDVYKKDIAGFGVPAFRGEKVVAVSSDLLFDMLVDFNTHAGMSERVLLTISEVLKTQGNTVEFFQLVDTPAWTMARDRCWFNRAVLNRNYAGEQGRHRQTWETLSPEHYPEYWKGVLERYPRALHLPVSMGSWEVVPLGPKSTLLIYRVIIDPGGHVPNGLQEFITGKTLPDNLLQFEAAALERAVP